MFKDLPRGLPHIWAESMFRNMINLQVSRPTYDHLPPSPIISPSPCKQQKKYIRLQPPLPPPPIQAPSLATTGCVSLHTRRMELCSNLFTKIKEPEPRLRHLVPPTRAQAHGRSLRNKDSLSLISCKTERFKRSFFPAMCLYAQRM